MTIMHIDSDEFVRRVLLLTQTLDEKDFPVVLDVPEPIRLIAGGRVRAVTKLNFSFSENDVNLIAFSVTVNNKQDIAIMTKPQWKAASAGLTEDDVLNLIFESIEEED